MQPTGAANTTHYSVPVMRITHAVICCQANNMAPRIAQFFPYTTCKVALIGCFVCGVIHYVHLYGLMRSVEYSLEGVLVN